MSTIEKVKQKFGDKIAIEERKPRRIYISAPAELAGEVVTYLVRDQKGRLSTLTGVDTPIGIELLYHVALDKEGVVITVRTLAHKPELRIASITPQVPAANWVEREVHEMLGVEFVGHPKMETLLLPDDWPPNVYPLRKQTFESMKENEEREN
jgi:Ni,Fe-hydrogenase III component G